MELNFLYLLETYKIGVGNISSFFIRRHLMFIDQVTIYKIYLKSNRINILMNKNFKENISFVLMA